MPSLSAWGLPTPVVALACIGNVDIQVFSCADGESYFLRRLQAGGGVHPRSILSRAAMSKPSGGIARCPRCPPGACQRRLLPLPVSVMLIFRCFLVQAGNFISYGVCKFAFLGSPLGELSPQVTEGFPATAANRFHKELRFFFSLLKRKKEAKKEKSSHSTCTVRFQYHPKITQETVTIDSHQQNSPGGANRRLPPP